MSNTEVVGAALAGLLLVVGFLFDRYILWVGYWPVIGRQWRRERKYVLPAWTGPDSPQTPVPVDDEPWTDEPSSDDDAEQMIATWRGYDPQGFRDEEHEQLATVHPIYLDLSEDPDLIVWDAKQQADRCWEIVHIEFPRLRAELASMWEAAA